MRLDTYSYNNGTSTWNASTQEVRIVSFSVQHQFNKPARVMMELSDGDGSLAKDKYNVTDNDVYIAVGKLELEHPTGQDIFLGRLLKAQHSAQMGRTTLICEDWLSQLDDEMIDYDMRENLGSGLRESQFKTDIDSPLFRAALYSSGSTYLAVDDNIAALQWTNGKWNGYYMVLPVKNLSPTIKVGPISNYSEPDTLTANAWQYLWETDGSTVTAEDTSTLQWIMNFNVVEDGVGVSLYDDIKSVRVNVVGNAHVTMNAGGGYGVHHGEALVVMRGNDDVVYTIGVLPVTEAGSIVKHSFVVKDDLLSKVTRADGTAQFGIYIYEAGVDDPTCTIDEFTVEIDYKMDGYNSLIDINGTCGYPTSVPTCLRWDESASSFTEQTTDLNDEGVGDCIVFDHTIQAEDAIYFGFWEPINLIALNVYQVAIFDGDVDWEYWDGDSWEDVTGLVDPTTGFRTGTGWKYIHFDLPSDWATTTLSTITKYYLRCRVTSVDTSTQTGILTQGYAFTGYITTVYNHLLIGTDLGENGLAYADGFYYSIAKEAYKHIDDGEGGTIITGGDTIVTLTATTDIEHTDGVSATNYQNRTRLQILEDIANMDGAVFWIPLGTTNVKYKSTFNSGSPTAITDASVLDWTMCEYDWSSLHNHSRVYGVRVDDDEVFSDTGDTQYFPTNPAQASVTKYRQKRTQVIRNSNIVSNYEADKIAENTAVRDDEVLWFINADLAGCNKTYLLGTEVSVTSTHLGLTSENYVVTDWRYDSNTNKTQIRLHPRSTVGYISHYLHAEELLLDSYELAYQLQSDLGRNKLKTETW